MLRGCRVTAEGVLLARRELAARLDEEKQRAERTALPLSVIVCDVGAVEGLLRRGARFERFMREFSGFLSSGLRRVDLKGWYDRKRVAVLMPATPEAGARAVLGRLSERVAALLREEGISADAGKLFEMATYPDAIRRLAAVGGPDELRWAQGAAAFFAGGPSLRGGTAWLKRAFDVAAGLVILVVSCPVMILAAVAARLSSPGPAVFIQTRLGAGGRPFRYFKFRSMLVGNDDAAHRDYTKRLISGEVDTLNNGGQGGLVLKLARDPRVTPVGRLLRRSSLDELPQILNVLKGDMSLVGPRPPIPYEVGHYSDWHLRRILSAKPGITGLWQVRSRSSSSFDEMVRMDLRYADTWSLWSDLKILLQTIPAVLSARGAY
jgi:lipopolysaccharide/colanic/teichoic acid biosynthesis glycosyltransferase/GGDEF domain-containing protein